MNALPEPAAAELSGRVAATEHEHQAAPALGNPSTGVIGGMASREAHRIRDAIAIAAVADRVWAVQEALPKMLGVLLFLAEGPYGVASSHASQVTREVRRLAEGNHR